MIYYINDFYDSSINREPVESLASNNKIELLLKIMNSNNIKYKNISYGFSKEIGLFRKKICDELIYMPCINFTKKNRFNLISIFFANIYTLYYLIKNVKTNDTVIVYHYAWMYLPLAILKKFRKFNYILELEELYCIDSSKKGVKSKIYSKLEDKIIKNIDKAIVVNDIIKEYLQKKYDFNERDIVVAYGNYEMIDIYEKIKYDYKPENSESNKINLLYSGSIDKVRGVMDVVKVAKLLDKEKYTIYISGYGSLEEIENLKKLINGYDNIIFMGALNTNDYHELLLKSDICLSCQNDMEEFGKFSFPSKIINYLSFNKYVISSKLDAVIKSELAEYIEFYKYKNIDELKDKIINYNKNEKIEIKMRDIKIRTENQIIKLLGNNMKMED